MPYDGRAIANLILDEADIIGSSVSNLSLQKITFFCHAWNLVEENEPLVKSEFQAWKHGPVLQYLYNEFRDTNDQPITTRAKKLDASTGQKVLASENFPISVIERVRAVVKFYIQLSAWDLVELSHQSGGPWDQVWNHSGKVNPGMRISNDTIKTFYSTVSSIHKVH